MRSVPAERKSTGAGPVERAESTVFAVEQAKTIPGVVEPIGPHIGDAVVGEVVREYRDYQVLHLLGYPRPRPRQVRVT